MVSDIHTREHSARFVFVLSVSWCCFLALTGQEGSPTITMPVAIDVQSFQLSMVEHGCESPQTLTHQLRRSLAAGMARKGPSAEPLSY